MQKWWQAIIWTNDLLYRHIYASLSLNEKIAILAQGQK